MMIGSGNITLGPAFVIQEDYAVKQPARPHVAAAAMFHSNIAINNRPQQQESSHDTPEIPSELDLNQVKRNVS